MAARAPCTGAHGRENARTIGLSEAAAATGVNRSTIYRALKAGRLSANRADTGQIEVDPPFMGPAYPRPHRAAARAMLRTECLADRRERRSGRGRRRSLLG